MLYNETTAEAAGCAADWPVPYSLTGKKGWGWHFALGVKFLQGAI